MISLLKNYLKECSVVLLIFTIFLSSPSKLLLNQIYNLKPKDLESSRMNLQLECTEPNHVSQGLIQRTPGGCNLIQATAIYPELPLSVSCKHKLKPSLRPQRPAGWGSGPIGCKGHLHIRDGTGQGWHPGFCFLPYSCVPTATTLLLLADEGWILSP